MWGYFSHVIFSHMNLIEHGILIQERSEEMSCDLVTSTEKLKIKHNVAWKNHQKTQVKHD